MALEKWIDLAPEKKYKISEESARTELSRLMAWYETDLDEPAPDQAAAIDQILNRLLTALRMGKLEL